jgi:hypothetical protein
MHLSLDTHERYREIYTRVWLETLKGDGLEDPVPDRKIIIIYISCNWVITRWQWLFYIHTNMEKKK